MMHVITEDVYVCVCVKQRGVCCEDTAEKEKCIQSIVLFVSIKINQVRITG